MFVLSFFSWCSIFQMSFKKYIANNLEERFSEWLSEPCSRRNKLRNHREDMYQCRIYCDKRTLNRHRVLSIMKRKIKKYPVVIQFHSFKSFYFYDRFYTCWLYYLVNMLHASLGGVGQNLLKISWKTWIFICKNQETIRSILTHRDTAVEWLLM